MCISLLPTSVLVDFHVLAVSFFENAEACFYCIRPAVRGLCLWVSARMCQIHTHIHACTHPQVLTNASIKSDLHTFRMSVAAHIPHLLVHKNFTHTHTHLHTQFLCLSLTLSLARSLFLFLTHTYTRTHSIMHETAQRMPDISTNGSGAIPKVPVNISRPPPEAVSHATPGPHTTPPQSRHSVCIQR